MLRLPRNACQPARLGPFRLKVCQVLDEFGLWGKVKPNSRCLECNRALKALSKARARNLVSPYVLEHAESFALCPGCGRVFWQGTHFGDMERKIEAILKRRPS